MLYLFVVGATRSAPHAFAPLRDLEDWKTSDSDDSEDEKADEARDGTRRFVILQGFFGEQHPPTQTHTHLELCSQELDQLTKSPFSANRP